MGEIANRRLVNLAMLGVWGMSMSATRAAPPVVQRAPRWDSRPALDLRSSLEMHAAAATAMAVSEKNSEAFPSSLHRQTLGGQAREQNELPALESMGTQSRIDSPMQALARRVHREGLPVARLWENKSALVSLGLNQKGKPGLWIIQKIH
jgi:hypothetical protein